MPIIVVWLIYYESRQILFLCIMPLLLYLLLFDLIALHAWVFGLYFFYLLEEHERRFKIFGVLMHVDFNFIYLRSKSIDFQI